MSMRPIVFYSLRSSFRKACSFFSDMNLEFINTPTVTLTRKTGNPRNCYADKSLVKIMECKQSPACALDVEWMRCAADMSRSSYS